MKNIKEIAIEFSKYCDVCADDVVGEDVWYETRYEEFIKYKNEE